MGSAFKNSRGLVRSGWIIALGMVAYYALLYVVPEALIMVLSRVVDAVSLDSGSYQATMAWLGESVVPTGMQYVTSFIMVAVSLAACKIMGYRWEDFGLNRFCARFKQEGVVGLVLGFAACTAIFVLLLVTGNVVVERIDSPLSVSFVAWVLVFVFVGIAEEVMNRGFVMSALRRTNSTGMVFVVPALLFASLHLFNPNITVVSVVNLVLFGLVFSYMYYKSGTLWMCIGFHISWNVFQSVIYGMPVSGFEVPTLLVSRFPTDNLLNGGAFGIEGGVLTTIFALLALAFTIFYYRSSQYHFFAGTSVLQGEAPGREGKA